MASSFQARVDAAFGALSATPQQPSHSWAVSEQQVHRAGKDSGYSSDEEEQARAADAQREQLLPEGLLRFEGGADGVDGGELPSHAFCRALDEEEDFDAHDALASGVVDARPEQRPPRHTEVLEDNVFETRSRARAISGSEAGAMEIEAPRAGPSVAQEPPASHQEEGEEQPPPAQADNKTAKRVRFAEPDAVVGRPPRDPGSSQRGRGSEQLPQSQPRPRGGRAGLSYVPDHVRHPERYTAYVLEEPIEVGSGKAGADGGRGENMQAARAAQAAASAASAREPEADAAPALELPSFGGGIAFTPKSQRSSRAEPPAREPSADKQAAGGSSTGAGPGAASEAAAEADQMEAEAAAADQAMEVEAGEPADGCAPTGAEFAARGKRQRNLRSRGA